MKRLQTVMNVLVFIFCNILELLMSRVGRNNKVYELDTALKRVRQKEDTRTHLPCRGLSALIHPPTREHCVLDIRQIKETEYSVRTACFVWTPNTSNKDSFLALRWRHKFKNDDHRDIDCHVSIPGQDDKCLFQRRQPVYGQTRSAIRMARLHPPLHVAQQWFPTIRHTYLYSAQGAQRVRQREHNARVNDTTTNRGTGLQAKLRRSARCQPIPDGFPGSQHVRSQRCKLVLHERIQPNLRHERAVPTISGDVRALASERAEGARPRTCGTVREEIGEIEELAAFEAVRCHVVLQPEDFWDFHLKLKEIFKGRYSI